MQALDEDKLYYPPQSIISLRTSRRYVYKEFLEPVIGVINVSIDLEQAPENALRALEVWQGRHLSYHFLNTHINSRREEDLFQELLLPG